MKKTAAQKAIDNRANQLNPNNPAYYKSRMGSYSQKNNNQKTVVVHHHHNHTSGASNHQTRLCPICGSTGHIQYLGTNRTALDKITRNGGKVMLKCKDCGGTFHINRDSF